MPLDRVHSVELGRPRIRLNALVVLVVILGISATAFAVYQAASHIKSERDLQASIILNDVVNEIEARAGSHVEVLYGLRGMFHANEDVTRTEFSEYVESNQIAIRHPGVHALSFNRLVLAEDIEEYETAVRADPSLTTDGLPSFKVHPPSRYEDSFVVEYIVPHEPNRQALGFDIGTNPARRSAVEEARDTGAPAATSGITLVQEASDEIGFLVLLPVYNAREQPGLSTADRRAAFVGMVTGVFVVDEVLASVVDPRRRIDVEVYDSGLSAQPPSEPEEANLLFNSDDTLNGVATVEADADTRLATIEVGGRWWTIVATRHAGSGSLTENILPWLLLAGGVLLTLSLAGLARALVRSRTQAENLASQMTKELTETTRQMKVARDQAVSADSSKTEFLANMSHELRTPLTGVLGMSELLQNQRIGPLNDKQTEYVDQIQESGNHLLELINDLLDLAKIESGDQKMHMAIVSPSRLVADSIGLVRELAVMKGVALVANVDQNIPPITGDALRLKQALVNLLSNAVRFTDSGGRVSIEANEFEGRLDLVVNDTGVGIPDDEYDEIFEPFVQAKSGGAAVSQGTGLGLSVTKSIIEMHGGTIDVLSELGVGSRFTISLPTDESLAAVDESADPEPAPTAAGEDVSPRNGVVLIADDDPVLRAVLDEYLSNAGFAVHLAADGGEAIEMASLIRPDVVLMDIRMPRVDGLEAVRRMRSARSTKDLGIIMLSANAMPEDRAHSAEAGCDEFLTKPVDFDRLTSAIAAVIEMRPQTAHVT